MAQARRPLSASKDEPSDARTRILDAAVDQLRRHGPAKTGVVDVARALGVSHAAVYRYFASKDELLLAALALRDEQDEELARRIMESKVPAERVLTSVLREEFAHPETQRNWLAITVAATNPDHPAHDFFLARRDRLRQSLTTGRLATTEEHEELTADEGTSHEGTFRGISSARDEPEPGR